MKIAFFCCALPLMGMLGLLTHQRTQYNIVSHQELVAVREKLKLLTPQEQRELAFFINQLIVFDHYPYTLIGYKPMSISNIIVEDTDDLSPFYRKAFTTERHQILKQGYLVWKKHQYLFCSGENILIEYSFLGQGRKELAVINPKLCIAKIEEHLDDFQESLKTSCTTAELFSILTHPEHADFYKIIDHTRLMGILLGFGRNNAYLYEQYKGGSSRSVTTNQQSKENQLQMFSNEWPWPRTPLSPDFVCDPTTEETQELKNHYEKASKLVRWSYFMRNKVEVTLALFGKSY